MCFCVHEFVCVFACVPVRILLWSEFVWLRLCVCARMWLLVRMYVCLYVSVSVCFCVRANVLVCFLFVCLCVCICMCACACMWVCACVYVRVGV